MIWRNLSLAAPALLAGCAGASQEKTDRDPFPSTFTFTGAASAARPSPRGIIFGDRIYTEAQVQVGIRATSRDKLLKKAGAFWLTRTSWSQSNRAYAEKPTPIGSAYSLVKKHSKGVAACPSHRPVSRTLLGSYERWRAGRCRMAGRRRQL